MTGTAQRSPGTPPPHRSAPRATGAGARPEPAQGRRDFERLVARLEALAADPMKRDASATLLAKLRSAHAHLPALGVLPRPRDR